MIYDFLIIIFWLCLFFYYNAGTCTIIGCSITNNTAAAGNNSAGPGGGVYSSGDLIMTNCTVVQNMATFGFGGGVALANDVISETAVLTNCTITNNTATRGGPFNVGGFGGGIGRASGATVLNSSIGNTIIFNNLAIGSSASGPEVSGAYVSNGYNSIFITSGSTGFVNGVNGDQVGVNPLLNTLANYGGPTLSRTLLPASSCINAGSIANIPPGIIFDQRGPGFPRVINSNVDIGAVEFGIVCFSGESLVLVKNKLTDKISEIKAKEVYADIHEVFDTINKKFIPIKYNVITGSTKRYMKIEKNSLGENKPNEDFFITSGHRILYNGEQIKALNIPGAKRIKVKPENVYSICTEEKTAILINNLDVMTWGQAK